MKKILIAEDNELNMKLMKDVLEVQGFDVNIAIDGEAAFKKITSNKYDLLLLDLQMPKLSGFYVLEKIKKREIELKTIVVSACAMQEEIERAKNLGCIDYITKPIRINEFIATVKKNLG